MTETKALTPLDEVKRTFTAMAPQFKMALPPHVSPDKFVRTILTAIQTTPALMKANRQSLYAAAMKCASAGLLPDGKEAALVPFKDQVQFMPMIGGILKQLRNTGELASIAANVVFKNDFFRYWVDEKGEHLEHTPVLFGDRGDQIGVYALAVLKDGSLYVEVMTNSQIEDVRRVSRAKDGPAWNGPFKSEMAKKTVIRRLSKRLPISTDKAPALDSENDQFDFDQAREVASEGKPAKKSRMKQLIENDATAVIEHAEDATIVREPDVEVEVESEEEATARGETGDTI